MASQPIVTASWKQEVNRRVAAHKSRRGLPATERDIHAEARSGSSSLAAQAAARVAARYAQAPSYSQMQAAEARTAVRAAEIATQACRRPPLEFHLEPKMPPEMPARKEKAAAHEPLRQQREFELLPDPPSNPPFDPIDAWWQPSELPADPPVARELDRLEAAPPEMPAQANLLQFPLEQAAARKPRSQAAAAPQSAPSGAVGLLSIFEVDPGTVSIQGEEALEHSGASQWSGIELDAHPLCEGEPEAQPANETACLELAPFSQRALAALVDGALITSAFLAAASLAAANIDKLPSLRLLEIGFAAGMFAIGLMYQAIFFTLADATPGMKYAKISLCTFDDQCPTRAQLHGRLGALLLSVLPLGLGLAWAIFDEDHLSWHDRLSKTYQRKCEP